MKRLSFKWLSGDVDYLEWGAKWISNKCNNGEFDYYFVLSLTNLIDVCGERESAEAGGKYLVDMDVIAPGEFQDKDAVLRSCGESLCTWDNLAEDIKVEMLSVYGGRAAIFSGIGNNFKKLFKEAKLKAKETEFLFGFAMDRCQNAIGSTGWDMLRGDVMAGLRRYKEAGKTDLDVANICLKMHGGNV